MSKNKINNTSRRFARYKFGKLREKLTFEQFVALTNNDEFLDTLLLVLKEPNYDYLTDRAIEVLVQAGTNEVINRVLPLLQNKPRGIVCAAVEILGKICNPVAVEPLIQALNTHDYLVLGFIADSLGEMRDSRAVEPLITTFRNKNNSSADEYNYVTTSTLRALGKIGGINALDFLLDVFNSKDSYDNFIRSVAAEAMGQIKDSSVFSTLIRALNENSPEIRQSAAEGLGQHKNPLALEFLINTLKDSNEAVRAYAATALGNLVDQKAILPLIELLDENNNFARLLAVKALGKFSDEEVIHPLIQVLQDSNQEIVMAAARALSNFNSQKILQLLLPLLDTESANFRTGIIRTLGQIKDKAAIQPLINFINDPNFGVRACSIEALGNIGDEKTLVFLKKIKPNNNKYLGKELSNYLIEAIAEIEERLISEVGNQDILGFMG